MRMIKEDQVVMEIGPLFLYLKISDGNKPLDLILSMTGGLGPIEEILSLED